MLCLVGIAAGNPIYVALGVPQDPTIRDADPVRRVAGMALDSLKKLREMSEECKASCVENIAGRAVQTDSGRQTVQRADVDKWFAIPLQWFQDSISATRSGLTEVASGARSDQAFMNQCYQRIVDGVGKLWTLELMEAGNAGHGLVQRWLAELRQTQARWNDYWTNLPSDRRTDLNRRTYDQGLERDQRLWFQTTVPQYIQLMDRLAGLRQRLVELLFTFSRISILMIERYDDAHANALGKFRQAIYGNFSCDEGYDSALDFFVGFPGSPDRIITAIGDYPWLSSRPYPEVQTKSSPGLLKLNGIGAKKIAEILSKPPEYRVFWDRPSNAKDVRLKGYEKLIVSERYAPGRKPRLSIAAIGWNRKADLAPDALSATLKDLNGGRSVRYGSDLLKLQFDDRGVASTPFDLDAVLSQVGGRVNTSVLEASLSTPRETVVSLEAYFPLRQRLIVFVPGVLGSEIYVRHNNREIKAFPVLSTNTAGEQPFTYLKCGPDGNPRPGNEATKLDLFRTLFGGLLASTRIYLVERQSAIVEPPNHPELTVNGRREPYYLLVPWAYDWRLKLELAVSRLLGAREPNRREAMIPPYGVPPSLQDLIAYAKSRLSFSDEKAVVTGHSTGGVILRNLINRSGASSLVSDAVFIDVPFWGAPKAYYVYLTGDMGVPIIAKSFMRDLSPNAPIVYYLAHTERYPDPVVRIGNSGVNRGRNQNVRQQVMAPLIQKARGDHLYPAMGPAQPGQAPRIEEWNSDLENSARAFHLGCEGEPQIGWEHCTVFWSDSGKNDTVGTVYVASGKIAFAPVAGDSTVPVVSQRAEFVQRPQCLIKIRSNPEHVPSPNDAQVWDDILARLTRPGS